MRTIPPIPDKVTSPGNPVQLVLERLDGVKAEGSGRWSARCPAHEDRVQSLSVSVGTDDRALIHCHAGCETAEIVEQLGLTVADLFPRATSAGRLNSICLAGVQPEEIKWLWPSRFPMGKLSILAGPSDYTHYIIDDMAARISRGNPWPDTLGIENPIGSVIVLHPKGTDMVLGRMGRAGADMDQVYSLDALYQRRRNGSYPRFFINRDLADLEAAINRIGDVRLVVFDTLHQHFGPGVTLRAPGSVGAVLHQLGKMAERTNVAVIGMMHIRRSSRSVACLTGAAPVGVPSAARAIWFVVDDPDDLDTHYLLPAKVINGKPAPGLRFRIVEPGRLDWSDGPVGVKP